MTDMMTTPRRVEPDEAADILESLRRDMTGVYLRAREAFEENRGDVAAAARLEATTTALVRLLVHTGDYLRAADARAAIAALRVPLMAERWVSEWVAAHDLRGLDSRSIVRLADEVIDWVARDTDLDQIPMHDLVRPYLKGGTR